MADHWLLTKNGHRRHGDLPDNERQHWTKNHYFISKINSIILSIKLVINSQNPSAFIPSKGAVGRIS